MCQLKKGVDIAAAGLPCPPFSRQRHRKGIEPRQHKDFQTVFTDYPEFVREHRPKSFVIEETEGFLGNDPETGQRFLDLFVDMMAEMGYTCRALRMYCDHWITWPRIR